MFFTAFYYQDDYFKFIIVLNGIIFVLVLFSTYDLSYASSSVVIKTGEKRILAAPSVFFKPANQIYFKLAVMFELPFSMPLSGLRPRTSDILIELISIDYEKIVINLTVIRYDWGEIIHEFKDNKYSFKIFPTPEHEKADEENILNPNHKTTGIHEIYCHAYPSWNAAKFWVRYKSFVNEYVS